MHLWPIMLEAVQLTLADFSPVWWLSIKDLRDIPEQ